MMTPQQGGRSEMNEDRGAAKRRSVGGGYGAHLTISMACVIKGSEIGAHAVTMG